MRSRGVLILLVGAVVTFVSFGYGVSYGQRQSATDVSPLTELVNIFSRTADPSAVRTFAATWDTIHDRYVNGDLDDTALVRGAIRGLVGGLNDPYSTYFDPAEAKEFAAELNGTFEGVGMEIGFKDDRLAIIAPLPGTPAARAGLVAGDLLLKIDELDAEGLSIDEAISHIRGPKGTAVVLIIQRGTAEPQEVKVVRDTITIKTITTKMLNAGGQPIGYIQLTSFSEDTVANVRREVQSLLTQSAAGFILDLRNNPGGLLDASVEVAGIFVGPEVIVRETDKNDQRQERQATSQAVIGSQPVVVLVNGGSASASEIVAGALQDLGRATIIGQPTFGKGSVQQLEELPDGSTLKLTVAKWYTPKNRSISEQGITPDILVEPAESGEVDAQLDRALSELATKLQ